jgi:hypothetical protein
MACRRLRIWTPVVSWNAKAADRWGVRGDEAQGKHLMNLDIGLPVEQLRNPIRRYLDKRDTGHDHAVDGHQSPGTKHSR